jgi:hypothetical protein
MIALGIFLVGAALIPFVGLPREGFSWQRFADAYLPLTFEINYKTGSPGSFFTVNGYNFPPNDTITILANEVILDSVTSDDNGNLLFLINTSLADSGFYIIKTSLVDGPEISFSLSLDAPLRPQESDGQIIMLPAGIAYQLIHLPFVNK